MVMVINVVVCMICLFVCFVSFFRGSFGVFQIIVSCFCLLFVCLIVCLFVYCCVLFCFVLGFLGFFSKGGNIKMLPASVSLFSSMTKAYVTES